MPARIVHDQAAPRHGWIGDHHVVPTDDEIAAFATDGFIVLRHAFDAAPLLDEVQRSIELGVRAATARNTGGVGSQFRYVPMMCERTPVSLALLDALAPTAARLVGRPILPLRAKGTRYYGSTSWHRDSELDLASVGFLAYLEPLAADTGALRVLPGSHRAPYVEVGAAATGGAIATEPGDLIVFDEHLAHCSATQEQATPRHQWRVDYFADPVDVEEEAVVHEYLDGTFQPGWDGGYDVDAFPSYGPHWQRLDRPWVDRLRELGAYDRAAVEETSV
jgi:hypothetical protein